MVLHLGTRATPLDVLWASGACVCLVTFAVTNHRHGVLNTA